MNWEALAAIGEIVGAGAVVLTLVYLSLQIRSANKQAEIEALRHSWDGLNQFCDALCKLETASIVNRGRESLSNLDADEFLVFEHLHIRLLNTLESWHLQIDKTSKPGPYRDIQMENIAGVAGGYLGFPGTRELWGRIGDYFVPIRQLVDRTIGSDEPTT